MPATTLLFHCSAASLGFCPPPCIDRVSVLFLLSFSLVARNLKSTAIPCGPCHQGVTSCLPSPPRPPWLPGHVTPLEKFQGEKPALTTTHLVLISDHRQAYSTTSQVHRPPHRSATLGSSPVVSLWSAVFLFSGLSSTPAFKWSCTPAARWDNHWLPWWVCSSRQ